MLFAAGTGCCIIMPWGIRFALDTPSATGNHLHCCSATLAPWHFSRNSIPWLIWLRGPIVPLRIHVFLLLLSIINRSFPNIHLCWATPLLVTQPNQVFAHWPVVQYDYGSFGMFRSTLSILYHPDESGCWVTSFSTTRFDLYWTILLLVNCSSNAAAQKTTIPSRDFTPFHFYNRCRKCC